MSLLKNSLVVKLVIKNIKKTRSINSWYMLSLKVKLNWLNNENYFRKIINTCNTCIGK